MIVSGWGRYPKIDSNVSRPHTRKEISKLLAIGQTIARGSGRAYGDSAINPINTMEMRWFDQFAGFDPAAGVLTVNAGVQLREITKVFVPRGWWLPVTPGTSFATVGGSIASDVHGKNHHLVGTFGEHVKEIEIMLGNGEIVTASASQYADLFYSTCGGMGLTGVILSAKIQLAPVKSGLVKQKTIKASNLEELFELFEENADVPYSVAWVDCLVPERELGRSVLLLGDHAKKGGVQIDSRQRFKIPIDAPGFLLNRWSIKAFNSLYYSKAKQGDEKLVGLFDYFYPLDKIDNWNRMYGHSGFIQYQFVIPKQNGADNMRKLLGRIAYLGEGSFLAVIKLFGGENDNLLSFPFSGYTLALDFKVSQKTIDLLNVLDELVIDMGGRIYLTKDARMTSNTFRRTYPRWETFESVRQKYGAIGKFSSAQSVRLGLL